MCIQCFFESTHFFFRVWLHTLIKNIFLGRSVSIPARCAATSTWWAGDNVYGRLRAALAHRFVNVGVNILKLTIDAFYHSCSWRRWGPKRPLSSALWWVLTNIIISISGEYHILFYAIRYAFFDDGLLFMLFIIDWRSLAYAGK